MRERLRDWRQQLRGRKVRSVKTRIPLESSSSTQQPLPQPPGPSHGVKGGPDQGGPSRVKDQPQESQGSRAVRGILDRLGGLSLGPSTSKQPVKHNEPTEDQDMPDAPDTQPSPLIPDLPPLPIIPPPVVPEQGPTPKQDQGQPVKPPGDPGSKAAARVLKVAKTGFNKSNPGTDWSIDVPTREPVVGSDDDDDWLQHKVPGWGKDEKEDKKKDGDAADTDDTDDTGSDDRTERWMEGFASNKLTDRDYVDTGEPDDPEVCKVNSDEDIITFGVLELEFLLAVSSAMDKKAGEEFRIDPHPREKRWISRKLESCAVDRHDDGDIDTVRFKRYAARRMTRLLLRNNIPAHEIETGLYVNDLSESDFTDDERPNWKHVMRRFTVNERFDPNRTHFQNGTIGFRFADEFSRFCEINGIEIHKMKYSDMDIARERVEECLFDWPNEIHRTQVSANFQFKLVQSCEDKKTLDLFALATANDPLHIPIKNLDANYQAWSVVEDVSVNGKGMVPSRYLIPMFNPSKRPMRDYYWFGAEVVSPPLSFHDQRALDAVRKACGVLRSNLRCHKPMEVSSGLHVHLGHKHGWNLLQIKRFITLWVLTEPILIHLHRKDRGSARMAQWCGQLIEGTCLGQALSHPDAQVRYRQSGCIPRSSPPERARNEAAMAHHFDITTANKRTREFIQNVWYYPTISELTDALAGGEHPENDHIRPAVRARIRGNKKSEDPVEDSPATIEIRTMHGTLDADHILQWLVVLEKLLTLSRYASNAVYKGTIALILDALSRVDNRVHNLLLGLQLPPRTIHYFMSDINRVGDSTRGEDWWVYPDRDVVDWVEPFMVPGHRATHGAKYDFGAS
ncbi:hypothetical protein F4814DRAFT_357179 [Daldinia grandis]|nr:hypothetical protein F4814DRAFT_357179 [Daldinia grandis]